ncbi:hypothetical protein [Texcoconibacillus texcoconensis]|uniref:Uncharacterized protein n=1 Tax=Texcoconibacillus texcoconensis TaxID=1095777 RepID=A0A840QQ45_9BACI|nr:hypothetical protein [Texcoconibacillus texcoconensis]MBB5173552.1 hypothetical protein [Texcoconibacillus texcoconensis]
MELIPFSHTWPYEKMGEDIYIALCPYCKSENVLTSLTSRQLQEAMEQIKTRVNMPCCLKTMVVLEADEDYFWTDEQLRSQE